MTTAEEISGVASILAIIAIFNWLGGDRSFRGRELSIRRGSMWFALRWFGLGLWAATLAVSGYQDIYFECVGLAGAVLLLFGTARQVKKSSFTIGERNQTGEQGGAGQPR